MKFWLGTHMTTWLNDVAEPLFVSAIRLRRAKLLPRAACVWALDSGGFSALSSASRYTTTPREYVAEVRRWRDEIGGLQWAAIQDWMCEPHMVAKTGYSIAQHQQFTVNSWIELNSLDGSLPWVPVIQGWTLDDYHSCVDLYEQHAATRLADLPLVGVGSICRRQATDEAATIIESLYARGLRNLHGFGFKLKGLIGRRKLCRYLASSDSLAWSFRGRMAWSRDRVRLCGGEHAGSCANCSVWALRWRERLVRRADRICSAGVQKLMW